jgi:hypothetical protein
MWIAVPLLALCAFGYFVMWPRGLDVPSVVISLIFSVLIAYVPYLESRLPHQAPTKTETILATTWLVMRRVVAYGGALAFAFFAAVMSLYLVYGKSDQGATVIALEILVLLVLALCFVWFGRVGRGHTYDYRDDLAAHEQRRRRYRWKW